MKAIGLLLLGFGLLCAFHQAQARVTIHNRTPYEIKALVDFDWGREDFPQGAISKKGGMHVNPGKGIMPGSSYTRKNDAAQIKRRWRVWALFGESWAQVIDIKIDQKGAFVDADVYMTVDNKTGENEFGISVGR